MALRDPETQLPSEALFMDRLSQAMALARRKHGRIAIVHLHIESPALEGNIELVKAIARRLEEQLRASDTVARIQGHDFTILLNDVDSRPAARAVAEELLLALSKPLKVAGQALSVRARSGLGLFPDDADNEAELLKAAGTSLGTHAA